MDIVLDKQLIEKIDSYLLNHQSVNIIIAGCTCSGKTTLTKKLVDKYRATTVPQDAYFKNLDDIPTGRIGRMYDSINAFLVDEYKKDVEKFCNGEIIKIPHYEVVTNQQIERYAFEREMAKVNIFEGLHTLTLLDKIPGIRVYLDTPRHICLKRRIERDCAKYPVDSEFVARFWSENIWPLTELYVLPQKSKADIIIQSEG